MTYTSILLLSSKTPSEPHLYNAPSCYCPIFLSQRPLEICTARKRASNSIQQKVPPTDLVRKGISPQNVHSDFQHIQPHTPHIAMLQIQLNVSHLNSRPLNATRVTAPFNKIVRKNLCRNSTDHVSTMSSSRVNTTSGSDHDLESMIPCFLEEDEEIELCCSSCSRPDLSDDGECGSDAESSGERVVNPFFGEQLRQMLQGISSSTTRLEQMLQRDAAKTIGLAKENAGILIENDRQKSSLRRFVMNSLRCAGYNAGICKSRWEKTNGYPAGDYEFIDVVVEGCRSMARGARLLVDIGFAAQFEIARPTDEYCTLVQVLPTLFVGSEDKLRQIIRIMCDGAKRSLKTKEMPIPPWRKYRYVQAKWLGPYKRTIQGASTSTAHLPGEYFGVSELKGTRMDWELHP